MARRHRKLNTDTAIVRVVDGICFRLPELSKAGAEQARVTLTDLAMVLGYSGKHKLKELADRNAAELAEFGIIPTVGIMSPRGNGAVVTVQEPTFNVDQCIILGMASQTEVGRKMRVTMLKAYRSLLAEFERVVEQQVAPAAPVVPMTAIQLLVVQAQEMAKLEVEQMAHAKQLESHSDRLEHLEAHERIPENYFKIRAWARLLGWKTLSTGNSSHYGKMAGDLSRKHGVPIRKIPDSDYGEVNAYRSDILSLVMGER